MVVGIVGGTNVGSTGGGVDFQCLPLDPEWLNFNKSATGISLIRGVGYITHQYNIFPDEVSITPNVSEKPGTLKLSIVILLLTVITLHFGQGHCLLFREKSETR